MMSGPQFIHIQSYSLKANPAGQSVVQILGEAARQPEYSAHVDSPTPPKTLYGVTPAEVREKHDEMVKSRTIEVKLANGKTAKRGIRKDRHTLLTAVASYPLLARQVGEGSPDSMAYERWIDLNLKWLRDKFGERLVSVIEHVDEEHPHLHAFILPLDDPDCMARRLNPAWKAKEEIETLAKTDDGRPAKEAVKLGNRAYKESGRDLQDDYYTKVGLPAGLTRTGPKRERLSRQQWKARKDAAKLTARISQEIDGRLEGVVDAQDGLERSLAVRAEEIAEKLDLVDRALEEAEADRAEAQRLRQQAALALQNSDARIQQELNHKLEELEALHRQESNAERADLHRARQNAEQEARRLNDAQARINQDRSDVLRNAAQDAARVILELFLGVLDGSVRPGPGNSRTWLIYDGDLRERTKKLDLIDLVKDMMKVLHDAWTQLSERLSPTDQAVASEQIAEPMKATVDRQPGNQP